MISRRHFLTAAAATLAAPHVARAFELNPVFMPQTVKIGPNHAPGQLIILATAHFLYFVTEPRTALRYGVGTGRAGLAWSGSATIDAKKEWPTWRPTDEMIENEPNLYGKFKDNDFAEPGGPGNPLGARAMYLFENGVNTYYAIHGTNAPSSIGHSVSHGCIRMLNDHVIDLYQRVPIGTPVTVIL